MLITSAGLVSDAVGAWILAAGLIISKENALKLGLSRVVGETEEEQLADPKVQDRLRQSRRAKIGLSFLLGGFGLQLIGAWVR